MNKLRLNHLPLRFEGLFTILYFTVMTFVMTFPLLLRMGNEIIGEVGDNIYFVWLIGWTKRALFDLHVNPFDVWFLNYPQGWSLAYTEITPIQIIIAQPFCLIGGAVFAYNATMMLSFILAGLGMYLWIRRLTGNRAAALLAGTVFAFLPYHFAHFRIGHLNLSSIQWFPFYFWGLTELLFSENPEDCRVKTGLEIPRRPLGFWAIIMTGVSLGFIALTSQYYLFMTIIVSAFCVLFYIVFMDRSLLRCPAFWRRIVAAGLVALPLILAGIAPYVELSQQGGLPDRGIGLVRGYSASPTDFLLPSTDHFLWGTWVGTHFKRDLWIEATLYIGVVGLALTILAALKRRETGHAQLLKLLLWTGLCAFILALGTDLHWNETSVTIPTPALLSGVIHRPDIPLILPGYFLFYFFPLYAKLRAIMRFGIFVILFTSVASGIGAAWLLQKTRPKWRGWLTLVLLALVFVDFYPGAYTEFFDIAPRPVDYWLAEQPGTGAVVQMPFSQAEDQEQTFYTLTYRKPYVGGFFNAFPPEQYRRIRPVLDKFPDDESYRLLGELGVQYVLVDVSQYTNAASLRSECEALGLHYLTEIEGQMVFERK